MSIMLGLSTATTNQSGGGGSAPGQSISKPHSSAKPRLRWRAWPVALVAESLFASAIARHSGRALELAATAVLAACQNRGRPSWRPL